MLVYVESPYAGNVAENLAYLKLCLIQVITEGHNPYASHLFFTQFLDDNDPVQRKVGITLGNQWRLYCEETHFFVDLGWSAGMQEAYAMCYANNYPHRVRRLK